VQSVLRCSDIQGSIQAGAIGLTKDIIMNESRSRQPGGGGANGF
jgi:hypothetical protein